MNALQNIFNRGQINFGGVNPQQMVMNFLRQNPIFQQYPNKSKEIILNEFKNKSISQESFNKLEAQARQLGVSDDVLNELRKFID